MDTEWTIPEELPFSKARWTPFAGRKVRGCVQRVVLRGEVAYVDGQVSYSHTSNILLLYAVHFLIIFLIVSQVLVPPGFGQDVREQQLKKPSLLSASSAASATNHYGELNGSLPSSALDFERSHPAKEMDESHRHENGWDDSHDRIHHLAPEVHTMHRSSSPLPTSSNQNRYKSSSNLYSGPGAAHHSLNGAHVLSVSMFSKDHLNEIFNLAQTMRAIVLKDRSLDHILKVALLSQKKKKNSFNNLFKFLCSNCFMVLQGKVMASIFYEVSTRTSCSFAAAMHRLGGQVIYMDETSSSVKKGETLEGKFIFVKIN